MTKTSIESLSNAQSITVLIINRRCEYIARQRKQRSSTESFLLKLKDVLYIFVKSYVDGDLYITRKPIKYPFDRGTYCLLELKIQCMTEK